MEDKRVHGERRVGETLELGRILVPTDLSHVTDPALKVALEFARRTNACVDVLTDALCCSFQHGGSHFPSFLIDPTSAGIDKDNGARSAPNRLLYDLLKRRIHGCKARSLKNQHIRSTVASE